MAKVSRSVLKSLVKECLVEILSEGLVGANEQIQESKKVAAKKKPISRRKKPAPKRDVIPETIKGVTDDPLMQSIFADTARTTLREQIGAESNKRVVGGDAASIAADAAEPNELFGEAAANWAHLAFSEKKLPGQHK